MEKKENEKEKKEKDKKENEKDKKEKDKKEKEKDKKEKVKTPTHLLQKKTKKENNNNNIINNNTNQQRQNLNSKQNQRRILQHPNNKTINNNNNNIPKTQNNQNQITPEQNNQNQQINQNNNQIEQIDIQNNNQIVQNNNQNNNQINQNDNQNNNQLDQNDNQNIPPLPLNVFQAIQNDPVFNIFLNSFQNNNNQSQINNNQPPKREVTDPTEIKIKELIPKEFNKIFNLQSSDYQSLLTFLESKETNKKLFCTKLFRNEGGIICKDCSLESNAVICFDCFEDTKKIHEKHNVILKTLLSGNCDCGNPEIWKEESFCKNHKIKQIKNKKSSFDNEIIKKINNFFEEIFKIILPYFIKCEEEKNIAKNQTLFNILNSVINFFEKICESNSEIFDLLANKLLENNYNIQTNHQCLSNKKNKIISSKNNICVCSPLKILFSVWTEQNNKIIILFLKNQKLKEEITLLYFPMFKTFYINNSTIFDIAYEILIAKNMENAIKDNNYIIDILDLFIKEAKKCKLNGKYYILEQIINQFTSNIQYLVKKNTLFYFKENVNFYCKLIDFLNEIENLNTFKIVSNLTKDGYNHYVFNIENNTLLLVNYLFSLLNYNNKNFIDKINNYFLDKISKLENLKEDEFTYNISLIRGYSIFLNRYCFNKCKSDNKVDLFDSIKSILKKKEIIEKIFKILLKNISFILSIEFNFWVYYGQEMYYIRSDYFTKQILFLTDAVLLKYIFSLQLENCFNLDKILEIIQINNSHLDFNEKLFNNREKLENLPDVNFIEDGNLNKNINLNSKIFDYLLKILRSNIIFIDLLFFSYDVSKFGQINDEIIDNYFEKNQKEKIKLMIKEKLIYEFLSYNNLLSYSDLNKGNIYKGYEKFFLKKNFQDIFLSISNKKPKQNEQVFYSLKEEFIHNCDLIYVILPNFYSISEKYILNFKKVSLINTNLFEKLEIQNKLNLNCLKNFLFEEKNLNFIFNLSLNILTNKNFEKLNSYLLIDLLRSILTIIEINKNIQNNNKININKKISDFYEKIKDFSSNDKDLNNYLDIIKSKLVVLNKENEEKKNNNKINNQNSNKKNNNNQNSNNKINNINKFNNKTYFKSDSVKSNKSNNSKRLSINEKNKNELKKNLLEKFPELNKIDIKKSVIQNSNLQKVLDPKNKPVSQQQKTKPDFKKKMQEKFLEKNKKLIENLNLNNENEIKLNEENSLNKNQEEQNETEFENCLICQKQINSKDFISKIYGKIAYLENDNFIDNCKNNIINDFYYNITKEDKNDFLKEKKFRIVSCEHKFHFECFKNHVNALNVNNIKNFEIECPLCKKKSNCFFPNLNLLNNNNKNYLNGLNCFEENLKKIDMKNINNFIEKNPLNNLIESAKYFISNFIEFDNKNNELTNNEFNKLFIIFKDFFIFYQITQKKELQIEIIKNFIYCIRILLKSKENNLNEELFKNIFDLINKYKNGNCFNDNNILNFIDENQIENDLFKFFFIYLILFDNKIFYDEIFNLFFIYYCFMTYIQNFYIKNKLKINKNSFEKNFIIEDFNKFLNTKNNKILLKTFENFKEKIYFFNLLSNSKEDKKNLLKFDFVKFSFNEISSKFLSKLNRNFLPSLKTYDLIKLLLTNYKKEKILFLTNSNSISKNLILFNSNISFSSIDLNEKMFDFTYNYQREKCVYCKNPFKIGLICLMCGDKICNSGECKTNQNLSIFEHTKNCGGGNSVYIDNDNGEILFIIKNDNVIDKGIYVYLNNLGETVKNYEITDEYKLINNELKKVENLFIDLDFR